MSVGNIPAPPSQRPWLKNKTAAQAKLLIASCIWQGRPLNAILCEYRFHKKPDGSMCGFMDFIHDPTIAFDTYLRQGMQGQIEIETKHMDGHTSEWERRTVIPTGILEVLNRNNPPARYRVFVKGA